jgi:uncharacterized protein YhaN
MFGNLHDVGKNQNYSYELSSSLSEKTTAQLEEEDHLLATQVDEYNELKLAQSLAISLS